MIQKQMRVAPFSDKYGAYYKRCFSNQINCLEGAYRAGKSVINIFSFAMYLEYAPDTIHLVSGASASSARLNVSDCNGLGLSYLFEGRCRTGKYEQNDCLFINTKTGEKIVIFVGGGKSDSYKKIQGLSFGSWLSVELANLYISDDERCFVDMALSRLTQSQCLRVWWDLNPVYPTHAVYTKYLDAYEKQVEEGTFYGGYNYMKCSLFDNASLSPEQVATALSRYPDKESMEYQRYILGNRACAEGLIFKQFAQDPDNWIIKDFDKYKIGNNIQFVSIGVDFGGNGSNTTAVATLISNNYKTVCPFCDDLLDMGGGDKTAKDFNEWFNKFLQKVNSYKFGKIAYIFGDSADPVMINEIRAVVNKNRTAVQTRVLNCSKHKIVDRIACKKALIAKGNWEVGEDATHVINSTRTQVWSNKEGHEDERLDDGTTDVDTADAEEYSWSAFLDKLLARNR